MVKESTHPSVTLALVRVTNARDKISSARRPAAQKDLWRIWLNFDLTSICMLLMDSLVQLGQLLLSSGESSVPLPVSTIESPVPLPLSSGESSMPLPLSSGDPTVHSLLSSSQSTSSFRCRSSSGIMKVCQNHRDFAGAARVVIMQLCARLVL